MADFIREFEAEHQRVFSTGIIPVVVTRSLWQELVHNQTALFIRKARRDKHSRVVTTVPYYL